MPPMDVSVVVSPGVEVCLTYGSKGAKSCFRPPRSQQPNACVHYHHQSKGAACVHLVNSTIGDSRWMRNQGNEKQIFGV